MFLYICVNNQAMVCLSKAISFCNHIIRRDFLIMSWTFLKSGINAAHKLDIFNFLVIFEAVPISFSPSGLAMCLSSVPQKFRNLTKDFQFPAAITTNNPGLPGYMRPLSFMGTRKDKAELESHKTNSKFSSCLLALNQIPTLFKKQFVFMAVSYHLFAFMWSVWVFFPLSFLKLD